MNFSHSEVKSGVFVVLCFVLLTVLTFSVGKFKTFAQFKELKLLFNSVNGLEKNAPVHFAGYSVGKVKAISLREGNPAIEVLVEVDKTAPVRKDSQAFVDMMGLLGEKLISLTPGTPSAPLLEAGGVLQGTETVPIHHLVREMDELTQILIPLTRKTNTLLEKHQEDLDSILVNVNQISQNLNASSQDLKEMTHDLKLHPWKLLRKGGERRHLLF